MRLNFPLKKDDPLETVFIVDESSMVGDKESKGDLIKFGSGRLLTDLINYARLGRAGREGERAAKIIFVGDPAQLPPVTERLSPAMSRDYLKDTFGLESKEYELTEVMRQQSGSAVLDRATALRDAIAKGQYNTFEISDQPDEIGSCSVTDGVSMTVELLRNKKSSVFVTRTNGQALKLNRAVRGQFWGDEETPLSRGDLLLVNRNSYNCQLSNGDLVKVRDVTGPAQRRSVRLRIKKSPDNVDQAFASPWVRISEGAAEVELGFQPARIAFRALNGSVREAPCMLLENLLDSEDRELAPLEVRALLVDFRQRHPDLKPKTDAFNAAIRNDFYFNALQVKYGYAMTCHKAQGGEWDTAIVDFTGGGGTRNEEFFRWSYTAITRARKRLFTINAPRFSATSSMVWDHLVPGAADGFSEAGSASLIDDPDWDRFGFGPGHERLFQYHKALRDAWSQSGISIVHVDHMQYMERYVLSLGEKHADLQYHYKGNQKVSSATASPGRQSDPDLLKDALAVMEIALLNAQAPCLKPLSSFLAAFRDKLEIALKGTEVRLLGVESLQYRLRVTFEASGKRARVDFCYNDKKQWTKATEVGGLGKSQGLLERLQMLMDGQQ